MLGKKLASANQKHHPDLGFETRHQHGISALVSQTSLCRKTIGGVAKCSLFSQASAVAGFFEEGEGVFRRKNIVRKSCRVYVIAELNYQIVFQTAAYLQ